MYYFETYDKDENNIHIYLTSLIACRCVGQIRKIHNECMDLKGTLRSTTQCYVGRYSPAPSNSVSSLDALQQYWIILSNIVVGIIGNSLWNSCYKARKYASPTSHYHTLSFPCISMMYSSPSCLQLTSKRHQMINVSQIYMDLCFAK